ncbi:MAG: protein containing a thioredoxin domain [Bacteroidetes bacterium]|nr:protein containing a thioredoxin domain [Bacteroidota bacterium]
MKSIFLIGFFFILVCSNAQNKTIIFESGNWASVLAKAKKENKLIFIDAFTTWCGPCKQMAKHVFTNDSVADFFNSKFVNYKFDMEKGEGIDFAKKYQVNCYPNLILIDGNGTLVHRSAGLLEAPVFLAFARNGLTPGKTFVDLKNNYEKEGLNENNVGKYLELINSACFNSSPVVSTYIGTIKEADLIKPNNWELIRDYVHDYKSREATYLVKHLSMFEEKFGKNETEQKVVKLGANYFEPFTRAKDYDKAGFEKAKNDFKGLNWPLSDRILFDADLRITGRFDKRNYYTLASKDFLKYNKENANALNSMAWKFYEEVTDRDQVKAGAEMAKHACELEPNYANLDTYAAVLYKSGNYSEASKAAELSIEKAKEAKLKEEDYKETSELLKKIKANLK